MKECGGILRADKRWSDESRLSAGPPTSDIQQPHRRMRVGTGVNESQTPHHEPPGSDRSLFHCLMEAIDFEAIPPASTQRARYPPTSLSVELRPLKPSMFRLGPLMTSICVTSPALMNHTLGCYLSEPCGQQERRLRRLDWIRALRASLDQATEIDLHRLGGASLGIDVTNVDRDGLTPSNLGQKIRSHNCPRKTLV